MKKKRCSKCKKTKSRSEFGKCKSKADGLLSYCKICKKKYDRKRYDKNKEDILKTNKQYKEKNKDKISKNQKTYFKEYREKHGEKLRERDRKRHHENWAEIKDSIEYAKKVIQQETLISRSKISDEMAKTKLAQLKLRRAIYIKKRNIHKVHDLTKNRGKVNL